MFPFFTFFKRAPLSDDEKIQKIQEEIEKCKKIIEHANVLMTKAYDKVEQHEKTLETLPKRSKHYPEEQKMLTIAVGQLLGLKNEFEKSGAREQLKNLIDELSLMKQKPEKGPGFQR